MPNLTSLTPSVTASRQSALLRGGNENGNINDVITGVPGWSKLHQIDTDKYGTYLLLPSWFLKVPYMLVPILEENLRICDICCLCGPLWHAYYPKPTVT